MLLKKLCLKNIRSYKDAEINFPDGSVLLMGDIGSGKTSILLAIEFALFGLQPGQKGNSLMRNGEDEGAVELEFEIEDKIIKIERKIIRGNKSISQADCSITINNERYEGSVTEVKNKILTLLNYPPEFAKKTNDLYKFTVYTPQEEMKQIISESNDTRLNTLRHIFGIDKYKRIEENIEIFTAKMRQEIRIKEATLGNIEHKKQQIAEKQNTIAVQKEEIAKLEVQISSVQRTKAEKQLELDEVTKKLNEKNKLENEKDKSELTLNSKKDLLVTYEREIKNLNEQIKGAEKIQFSERDTENLKSRIKQSEKELAEMNENYIPLLTKLQANESRIRELNMIISKISSLDKCTTCLQIVNDEHKHNIVTKASQELREIESESIKKKGEKTELQAKIEQAKKLIDSLKSSLSQLEILKIKLESINEKKIRIKQLEKQSSAIISDIDMIKKHIEGIDRLVSEFSSYDLIYEKKNREMSDIIAGENTVRIKKAEINAEIQFLERQISDFNDEIKRIEEAAKTLAYMKELEFWLNSKFLELVLFTERNVMLKLREDFSNLFSNWFSILVSEGISVRLDESFSPIIMQNDYEIDYSYLSGGERTAVALAYRLALNQTINSLLSKIKTRDLVVLDEPTDGFSESQLDKIRDILNQLKVRQLILVSHEQKIESFVDHIIRFRKSDGVTAIEK